MKERILEHWRVLAASLFSTVLIVSVFIIVRGIESPPIAEASTESALLQSIASKDTDGDGLPDWEEALYGTDPKVVDSSHLGMTDGEAVIRGLIVPVAITDTPDSGKASSSGPETMTSAFAKTFFSLFVAAKTASGGADLSESEMNDVANKTLSSLASSVAPAPDFKSAKDLTVSGSGADALKAFAVSAEMVLMKRTSMATKSELLYLKDAIENHDDMALPHIASIAKAYRESAVGLAVLPVPKELAETDLALINAMMRTSQIATDFARVDTDPLATILALKQYPQAVLDLGNAFIGIGKAYRSAGIAVPAGVPGAAFVNLISDIATEQAAVKKP
ncbi:MAG: thrombospondin type 3 repeat-containing protein [Candidatus Kaiserbacteria bacterium]|nr:thrombospondin type 3 repeat-containing protein [Candidatus Kaiserbacteria bacterium]